MAIRSMTGFGRGEVERNGRLYTIEIRSVNNRYLDLKMKLPRGYSQLEEAMRGAIQKRHLRGRVDVFVSISGDFSDLQEVHVNTALAEAYMDALTHLADAFNLKREVGALDLAALPDIITRTQQEEDLDEATAIFAETLAIALDGCEQMRLKEGEALACDLSERLKGFAETVSIIEAGVPQLVADRQQAMQERLAKLLGNVQLEPARLAQEVALLADKVDVTEEIVRLRSHIDQFGSFLLSDGGVGRKLDFLIQEFLREVNTIASKISDASIAHHTVQLKSELEKMREQVQNIE